ncbi:MAG: c-type cytochrome [Bauldia sp.]|nr:c-type cytochrome [Bauldia sp.]
MITLRRAAVVAAVLGGAIVAAGSAQAEPSVERGQYLVDGLAACGNCHTPRLPDQSFDTAKYLAGGFEFNELPAFQAFARNITPDVDTGIGSWTEQEIVDAIREGHTPEGETVGPPMPVGMYNLMSDDDAMSIALYLKSIPAVFNEVPEATYNIPKGEYGPAPGGPTPSPDDPVAYGGYLATVAHCFDCHTPRNEDGSPDFSRAGAGGFLMQALPNGEAVYSANITSDEATGVGGWSDEALARAIAGGVSSNGHILFPIMPAAFFDNATDEDIAAIIAWLRTVPAVSNDIEQVDWMAALGMPPMQNAPELP